MRVPRFLSIIGFITFFCLFYVYQQAEIYRLAYVGQKSSNHFQDLLDKNTILRYNIERKVSLVHLGNKVSENSEFQMPDSYRLVKLESDHQGLNIADQAFNQGEKLVSRIFGIKRQAEAKTIGR